MLKKNCVKIFQFLTAFGLIVFLFTNIDKKKITELISQIPLQYLYLALFLLICQLAISAYRWLLIIKFSGFSLPFWESFGSCAISSFVNTTMPVAIAGDFMRMWLASRKGISSNIAINSVFTDRIVNTVSLGLIVTAIMLPYMMVTHWYLCSISIYMWALIYTFALFAGFLFLLFITPILERLKISHYPIFKFLIHLSQVNRAIFTTPYQLVFFGAVTVLGHLLSFSALIVLAKSIHLSLSLWEYLICVSTVVLFSSIPITPGGWGVREGAMLLTLGQFQVSTEAALSISIMFGLGLTIASIPGSIGWLIYKFLAKKSDALILASETSTN